MIVYWRSYLIRCFWTFTACFLVKFFQNEIESLLFFIIYYFNLNIFSFYCRNMSFYLNFCCADPQWCYLGFNNLINSTFFLLLSLSFSLSHFSKFNNFFFIAHESIDMILIVGFKIIIILNLLDINLIIKFFNE